MKICTIKLIWLLHPSEILYLYTTSELIRGDLWIFSETWCRCHKGTSVRTAGFFKVSASLIRGFDSNLHYLNSTSHSSARLSTQRQPNAKQPRPRYPRVAITTAVAHLRCLMLVIHVRQWIRSWYRSHVLRFKWDVFICCVNNVCDS